LAELTYLIEIWDDFCAANSRKWLSTKENFLKSVFLQTDLCDLIDFLSSGHRVICIDKKSLIVNNRRLTA